MEASSQSVKIQEDTNFLIDYQFNETSQRTPGTCNNLHLSFYIWVVVLNLFMVFWFLNSMTLFYNVSNSNQTTYQPQCVCQPCEIGQLGWSCVGRGHNIQRPCNIHPNLFLKRSNDWRRIMWYKLTPKAPTSAFLILPSEVKLWHRWAVSRNLVTSSLVRVPYYFTRGAWPHQVRLLFNISVSELKFSGKPKDRD